jgi:hypothetical protein
MRHVGFGPQCPGGRVDQLCVKPCSGSRTCADLIDDSDRSLRVFKYTLVREELQMMCGGGKRPKF